MKFSGTRNSEQSLEVTPFYFTYARQKSHETSHLFDNLIVRQFIVNEFSDKRILRSSNI